MSPPASTEPTSTGPIGDHTRAESDAPVRSPHSTLDVSPLHVPRDTTPTYEQELLVSGIVLVALFQLPGVFANIAHRYGPHMAGPVAVAVVEVARLIATAAVFALVTCFVVHLALRGFWVALVGTDSVFPQGTRWDRGRDMGPLATNLVRERYRPLRHYIGWFDNAATLVFTGGFLAAAYIGTGFVGAIAGLAVVAVLLAIAPSAPAWVVLTVTALLAIPLALVPVLDLTLGRRLQPGSAAYRVLRTGLRLSLGISPRSVGATSRVLSTNVDKRAVYGLLTLATVGAYAGAHFFADDDIPGVGAYTYFDAGAERNGMSAGFYDADRGDGPRDDLVPSIPAEVATGPYLRLFIPYSPRVHNEALPRTCPEIRAPRHDLAIGEDETADSSILACAARVHRVALDGRRLDVPLRFFADPRTERRGFVAQIPLATAAAGEHRLTVWPATRNGRPPARTPWSIAFWR